MLNMMDITIPSQIGIRMEISEPNLSPQSKLINSNGKFRDVYSFPSPPMFKACDYYPTYW